jgi:hypothetical protein
MGLNRVLGAFVIVALSLTSVAAGTDRYFRDSSAVSPSGRYRIEAKSPDNAGERPKPFAANFAYTLTDTVANKVVWERKQPMTRGKGSSYASPSEPSPVHVFVNDDGLVVARTAWDSIVILDPSDGSKRAEVDVLKAFPQQEHDTFVSMSTAGPIWSQESNWFFLSVPSEHKGPPATYFVVRPYWNHRLVIDTATGKHVDLGKFHSAASVGELTEASETTRRVLTAALEEETRLALSGLAPISKELKGEVWWNAYSRLVASLHDVAFLKLVQAESQLRALEAGFDGGNDAGEGARARVRQTLRTLGKTPGPGYGVRMYPLVHQSMAGGNGYYTADREHPYTGSVPVEQRTANASKVAAGMTMKEVTELLGCPDAEVVDIEAGGRGCDYDIDGEAPYTLRLMLGDGEQAITSVKKITPWAFLHDPARMGGY